jgi:ribosome-associated protein
MLKITPHITLQEDELQFSFIRASGPGGQNVNKVATAAQLRFDVAHSPALPDEVRQRLIKLAGNRMTLQGELIIKASRHRTQERNKQDAITQLKNLIVRAAIRPKTRKKTRPTYGSVQQRLASKKLHSRKKSLRRSDTD